MATQILGETGDGRDGDEVRGIRTLTRVFKVHSDDPSDGPDTVLNTFGLPRFGSQHNENPDAYCIQRTPSNFAPYAGWLVTCLYSTDHGINEDPTLDDARTTWSTEQFQKTVWETSSGEATLNSAGDYFVDPILTKDDMHLVAVVEKNVAAVPTWILEYVNATNDATVSIDGLSVDTGKAKLQRISISDQQIRNDIPYRVLTMEIHMHKDGWNLKPLDAGFRERDADGELVKIRTYKDGTAVVTPVPLDGAGSVLDDPTPGTAVFLDFEVYSSVAFSDLPLE